MEVAWTDLTLWGEMEDGTITAPHFGMHPSATVVVPSLHGPHSAIHLWEALRYTELKPVRASLVARAECWGWSSAAARCAADSTGARLAMHLWSGRWSPVTWRAYLDAGVTESQSAAIRRSTYSGRPLGSQEFTRTLEKETTRSPAPQKHGPKKRTHKSENQGGIFLWCLVDHLSLVEPIRPGAPAIPNACRHPSGRLYGILERLF